MQELKIKATDSVMFYRDHGNTSFAVHWKRNGESWGQPNALSKNDLKALTTDCASVPYVLPPEMLWYEEWKMMFWYSPPRNQMLKRNEHFKGKPKPYTHPPLIFRVHRNPVGVDMLSVAVVSPNYYKLRAEGKHLNEVIHELPYAGHDVNPSTHNVGMCNVAYPNGDFAYDLEGSTHEIWAESFYSSAFNQHPKRWRTGRCNHLKPTTTKVIDWMQNDI